MLYLPSVFGDGFMNDFFDDLDRDFFDEPMPVRRVNGHSSLMRTDITKKNGNYELAVELPGYKKDDVSLELENGYLNISAKHNESKEEKNDKGEVIRSERYAGNMARSFYVGNDIGEGDVTARFEDGVLHITIPAKDKAEKIPEHKTISIEG